MLAMRARTHQNERMTPKQFRMKMAGHSDTPSGLDAAYRRGTELAKTGGGELALNEALSRCHTKDTRSQLALGYHNELARRYKL